MGKFPTECSYNYSVFRDGDTAFSHGCSIPGWLIRVGQQGSGGPLDLSQPNHAFGMYNVVGQWFADEVDETGVRLNSLDEYLKRDNQIVAVMRYKGFDDPAVLQAYREETALWIRRKQNGGYGYGPAIWSALRKFRWLQWLKPILNNDPNGLFCSRDRQAFLKKYGAKLPDEWLDPLDLYDAMTRNKEQFEAVLNYKIIPGEAIC